MYHPMAYLDASMAEDKVKPSGGGGFSENLVARAVNQAVGRVIRHRFDYGAVLELLHKKALQRFVFNHSSRFTPIILISKSDCETIEDHSETEDYRQKYFKSKCHKICRFNNEPQISGRQCFQGCWNKCNRIYFIRKALDG